MVLQADQGVVGEEVRAQTPQTYCAHGLCHLTALRRAEELPWAAELQQAWQRVRVSVAQPQVWAQVSVALVDWRVLKDRRLAHRAAEACPL